MNNGTSHSGNADNYAYFGNGTPRCYYRLAGLAQRANLAPSPFHFSYFFQNVNIGHGGLIATIRAYYTVRSGEAYR